MLVKTPAKPKRARPNRKRPSSKSKKSAAESRSSTRHAKKASKKKPLFALSSVQPWKIILAIIIAGALGMLYLKHVFATQQLLSEVQQMEQRYEHAKRQHDVYRLMYDRMIGPKEIYGKAKAIGLIDGGPAEKVIEVKPIE